MSEVKNAIVISTKLWNDLPRQVSDEVPQCEELKQHQAKPQERNH